MEIENILRENENFQVKTGSEKFSGEIKSENFLDKSES